MGTPAPSEILVSREFLRFFLFNFHFSFSISSHLSFTFNSRKRVKGIYFSLFEKSESYLNFTLFSREKRVKSGVGYDLTSLSDSIAVSVLSIFFLKLRRGPCLLSLSSQILFF